MHASGGRRAEGAVMTSASKKALTVVASTLDPPSQSSGAAAPQLNRADTERFLTTLDPDATEFTFQTFDDNKERLKENKKKFREKYGTKKRYADQYTRVFNGSLADYWGALQDLNALGAGIFVTINKTNLRGRQEKNIIGIRAGFVDLDGAPLEPLLTDTVLPSPHIINESSPSKWHAFYLVGGVNPEAFEAMQKALAAHFNGDPKVHDLPRVMRLPGFFHRKDKDNPYLVRIHTLDNGLPYEAEDFLAMLAKVAPEADADASAAVDVGSEQASKPKTQAKVDREQNELRALNTHALQNLELWVPKLFPDATPYNGGYRVSSAMLGRDLEEDLGLMPEGIKDFGLADQPGEEREGKRTAIDIVMEHGKKDFSAACAWLREQLGLSNAQLTKMNEKYSVVQDGGRVDVLTFERHVQRIGKYQHVRHVPTFLSFQDFRNLHLNKNVFISEMKNGIEVMVPIPLGTWWLKHPRRRQYDGITFQPGGAQIVDGRFNLWRGFSFDPKAGDWSLMREHIREVLAAGNEESDTYIMNWLAWAGQHPDQRAEVALVFKGKKGSGKGTLGNTMVRIFGQHGVQISNAKHLTGFNAHLRDACFLFADEAYWPGDKSAEGDLKRLITEPTLFIEGKGRDAVTALNMLHVMMASNEDWIVPASERERRFAAFDVSECHIQQEKYFDAIYAQLEDGGYAAMLYELLQRDVSGWHPRRLPKNNALLLEQQRLSLSPLDSWWVELLEGGTLDGADPDASNSAVSNGYQRAVEEISHAGNSYTRRIKQPGLFDQARTVEPRLRNHVSDHLLGRYLRDQGCITKKVLHRRGWAFPLLLECRKTWEARFPGWTWRDPDIKAWTYEEEADGEPQTDPPF